MESNPLGLQADMPSMADLFRETEDPDRLGLGSLCQGIIVALPPRGAVVDMQSGHQGLVPQADLDRLPPDEQESLQQGQQVLVYVTNLKDPQGMVQLSLYLAKKEMDWLHAETLLDQDRFWEGDINGYNKGGLVVAFGHIRGFVPASQITGLSRNLSQEEKLDYLAQMVGQRVSFKVIEVDRRQRRLILSESLGRTAHKDWSTQQMLSRIEKGQTYPGRVRGLTDYGAFVDMGGAVGLVHCTELAWFRVEHPCEIVTEGQDVEVKVLRVNRERERISLSLKQTYPDPWATVSEQHQLNQLVEGRIIRRTGAGLFVMLDDGILGFVTENDIRQSNYTEEQLVLDQRVLARLVRIDGTRRRLGLSLRRVGQDERAAWLDRIGLEAAGETEPAAQPDSAEE